MPKYYSNTICQSGNKILIIYFFVSWISDVGFQQLAQWKKSQLDATMITGTKLLTRHQNIDFMLHITASHTIPNKNWHSTMRRFTLDPAEYNTSSVCRSITLYQTYTHISKYWVSQPYPQHILTTRQTKQKIYITTGCTLDTNIQHLHD